ncbi:STAS domain-containing protein [Phytohabitans aurantiacus]|jgi:anti-sigma B factor antagonist|uniref:Anti-sigma factor antagonist n=1 Tax=Phytohabitans aurantiacus TaxID=3016789 RepID=A0ABQ5QTM0_9ACTN|nr:STAS domain-containing protein [Phytohabitans aurantiacus]GLH97261.1 hypothetical protein Pa4123_25360 [Phytohabitans aurantiacus]
MGEQLRTEVTVGARGIDVRVTGEIDIANVDEFRAQLWALPAGPLPVRLDLRGVGFLSATAVRALVAVHLRIRARGGQLVLCDPNPVVRRTLRATRVNRVIPIVGSAAVGASDPSEALRRPWPSTPLRPRIPAHH